MTISDAIRDKKLLAFTYDGFARTVEPHTYGNDVKGHKAIRAYQVSGGSESGEYVGWKIFHVEKMRGLTVLQQSFSGARPKYNGLIYVTNQ